ncbi:hypothetical protein CaldiYA01_12360 [Caldicellulosiruptor diazotrophicus]|uniref:Uncharacterized protein n=1 Tax=Caldicellulosiruptor diazotrophicus TaxID=2806205 RepID=A0ABM7NMG0_9FIRM|nr:hypothetical protein CaldiYA01_12360 [Caldicellulosiruptor diazotrophicus]
MRDSIKINKTAADKSPAILKLEYFMSGLKNRKILFHTMDVPFLLDSDINSNENPKKEKKRINR